MDLIARKVTFLVLLLSSATCIACMSAFQSSFVSGFSLKELVERNQPNSGLDCAAGTGGEGAGIGSVAGGIGGSSNFHKGEGFSCRISDVVQFDETRFIQTLKASLEKDLAASNAEIKSSKNTAPVSFSIEYVIGKMSGRVEISGTRSPGDYYHFHAELDEKSADR